jgi:hypothetical protein
MEDNKISDLIWTGINLGIFVGTAVVTYILRSKAKTGSLVSSIVLVGLSSVLFFYVHSLATKTDSKYLQFDVPRCASRRAIQAKFRHWSRTIHPDQQASSDAPYTFEELDALKDFLSNDRTRTLYDKFDFIVERDNFDETGAKQLQNTVFQLRLYQYLNSTFIWVLFTFFFCKVLRELDLTNFLLKVLMAKAFVIIYFLYSQPVDECSILDTFFGHSTIFQQLRLAELVFSFVFGVMAAVVFEYMRAEKLKLRQEIGKTKAVVDAMEGDAPAVKELKESVKKFADLVNN